jgi:hypothetical protein
MKFSIFYLSSLIGGKSMSEVQQVPEVPQKEKVKEKKSPILSTGLDIGTMTIVFSRSDSDQIAITRNMFLKLDSDEVPKQDLKDITHVEMDGSVYIVGEDSFRMANLFNKNVLRPMERGMISPNEIDAVDVLTAIIKNLFGDIKDKEVFCSYSIPAEAIDLDRNVTYHEKVFSRILGSFGVNHQSVREGMAVVFAECQKEKYTGIGISFGAGMCNVSLLYKGVEIFSFSTTRSGDWIDQNVAKSLDLTPNRVTNIKEKYLDLNSDFMTGENKRIRRILEALHYYYMAMIEYTVKQIMKQFEKKFDLEVEGKIPVVVCGGTSMAGGFLKFFSTNLSKYDLPFDMSELRQAKNPLTCVSQGLLTKTLADLS